MCVCTHLCCWWPAVLCLRRRQITDWASAAGRRPAPPSSSSRHLASLQTLAQLRGCHISHQHPAETLPPYFSSPSHPRPEMRHNRIFRPGCCCGVVRSGVAGWRLTNCSPPPPLLLLPGRILLVITILQSSQPRHQLRHRDSCNCFCVNCIITVTVWTVDTGHLAPGAPLHVPCLALISVMSLSSS